MTDSQRVDAVAALKILGPLGTSLTEAATAFAERAKLLSKTVSFRELHAEVIKAKAADGNSNGYINDVAHRLRKFGETFNDRPVAGIETREIDDWLRGLGLSPSSRYNCRKVLRTAFEFAAIRGYLAINPVIKTTKVTVELGPPGILSPKEIGALLMAADSRIVPSLAIAAFAGLRDAEIGRITWDKIDLAGGHIKVDAAIAKTSSRRVIPISPNLSGWLAPYAQKAGPVRPPFITYYRLCRQARPEAAKALSSINEPCANLKAWPKNALRHSFSTYRMAQSGNPVVVAEECGHSVFVMKSHYRELVTPAEGKLWFDVTPSREPNNIMSFETVAHA